MKKKFNVLLVLSLILSVSGIIYSHENVNAAQNDESSSFHNTHYSTIDENGNVEIHEYEPQQDIVTTSSNQYRIVSKHDQKTHVVDTFDHYEEAKEVVDELDQVSLFSTTPTVYEIETIADTKSINYGVARIVGYTTYEEYDGSKTGRVGYTHGTSANDAAYISTSQDKKTIRVKQAGIMMDVPAENVEISEYNSQSLVSHYKAKGNILYHYYYSGSYGSKSTLNATQVGYKPSYLKEGVKYYSYDGHYFYNDYKTMINDYREGPRYFSHAVNKNEPFYNYYQYLSMRAPTKLTAKDFDDLVVAQKGQNTKSKLKNQGQALINVQNKIGINASLMFGVSINESAWGMSRYSQERNNLFGIGAYDSNPDKAKYFDTVEDCFQFFSYNTLSNGFLDGMDWRYRGPHLGDKQSGINVKYASDPYWGEKAASFSYTLDRNNAKAKDYNHYEIGISNDGGIHFYNDTALKKEIYDSTINDRDNYKLYNNPVTMISKSTSYYKIFSDTLLRADRLKTDPDGYFDINRDYVYISPKAVTIVNRTQKDEEVEVHYKKGDVNGDNAITPSDYVKIKNHIMEVTTLKGLSLEAADVNSDGKITPADYVKVKNMIMQQ